MSGIVIIGKAGRGDKERFCSPRCRERGGAAEEEEEEEEEDYDTNTDALPSSSQIKIKRAEKTARFSVPIPKVRGISDEEAFRIVKT